MNILFITSPQEDYLADSLLLGFRELLDVHCVDYPKADVLYKEHGLSTNHRLYGKGFTLYSGLLEDKPIDRFRIFERVEAGEFDYIIFGNIWSQYGWFVQLRPWLSPQNAIILDGVDTPQPYPAAGLWWRRSYYWCLPRAHQQFLYFKREWTKNTRFTLIARLLPEKFRKWLPHAKNLRRIAFSIPSEKIVSALPEKTKEFPNHIVDPEVAERVPGAASTYAFSSESEYYHDLQSARFGITTKRSGWDCLRHYEIAANGAVPCFRDLDKKPTTCAPHGLDETNSITYHSADELFDRLGGISSEEYASLQAGALKWVRAQTTQARAREVINVFEAHRLA